MKMHVRVPDSSSLDINARKGGDILVRGDLNGVHAHTLVGNIIVHSATGALQLTTDHGSLDADSRSPDGKTARVELHALNGNITLFNLGSSVLATTTGGNIRFVGSLAGMNNSFSTTGAGSIVLALPADISYSFEAAGGGHVINDFTPGTLICGMVDNPAAMMKPQPSPDVMGYIDVSGPVTSTNYISGTLKPDGYFRFYTNRSEISRHSPNVSNQPNGANAANVFWAARCEKINPQELGTVQFTARAEKGTITTRLIRKH